MQIGAFDSLRYWLRGQSFVLAVEVVFAEV